MGKLAGVSTPTISRFESGGENIELSSVLNILQVLGMRDSRRLEFPNPNEKYDSSRGIILFFGVDSAKKIPCGITLEALDDHFEARKDPMRNFLNNRKKIESEARKKYIRNLNEKDGLILIRTEDL